LTLPWLQAMETNTIYKLWQLIVGTRFVQLTNEWELSDFFSVTCDNPEVDEELIAATEIGLDAGAFGILHQLWAELTDIKALSCCDRTKTPNVCKNCPTQSANCGIAGTPCPVGATPCR